MPSNGSARRVLRGRPPSRSRQRWCFHRSQHWWTSRGYDKKLPNPASRLSGCAGISRWSEAAPSRSRRKPRTATAATHARRGSRRPTARTSLRLYRGTAPRAVYVARWTANGAGPGNRLRRLVPELPRDGAPRPAVHRGRDSRAPRSRTAPLKPAEQLHRGRGATYDQGNTPPTPSAAAKAQM